jgi:hypothetical protein
MSGRAKRRSGKRKRGGATFLFDHQVPTINLGEVALLEPQATLVTVDQQNGLHRNAGRTQQIPEQKVESAARGLTSLQHLCKIPGVHLATVLFL